MAVVRSRCLLAAGARVRAYDPAVTQTVGGIEMAAGACDAARGADVLCVLTEWPEFTQVDLRRVRLVMASPRIVDARNLLCPLAVEALGFTYDGIGRHTTRPRRSPSTSPFRRGDRRARLRLPLLTAPLEVADPSSPSLRRRVAAEMLPGAGCVLIGASPELVGLG